MPPQQIRQYKFLDESIVSSSASDGYFEDTYSCSSSVVTCASPEDEAIIKMVRNIKDTLKSCLGPNEIEKLEKACNHMVFKNYDDVLCSFLSEQLCIFEMSEDDGVSHSNSYRLVGKILSSLERVYFYCSVEELQSSFHSFGHLHLVPLLLQATDLSLSMISEKRTSSKISSRHIYTVINSSISIMDFFSRLEKGHSLMGRNHGYIDILVKCVLTLRYSTLKHHGTITQALFMLSRYDRLRDLMYASNLMHALGVLIAVPPAGERGEDEIYSATAVLIYRLLHSCKEDETNLFVIVESHSKWLNYLMDRIERYISSAKNTEKCQCTWESKCIIKSIAILSDPWSIREKICLFNNGRILETLSLMLVDDIEGVEVSKVLHKLLCLELASSENYNLAIFRSSLHRISLDEVINGFAMIALNYDVEGKIAAEATVDLLSLTSYQTFHKIVLLLSIKSNHCLQAAVKAVVERIEDSETTLLSIAKDEVILSVLINALNGCDENWETQALASRAVTLISESDECKEALMFSDNVQDLEQALTCCMKLTSSMSSDMSSEDSYVKEALANSTLALCNFVCVTGS
mmetsp:Transcript_16855/g.21893  ORF Transcript_16855/g.21893 Transcript_16855/m.21893 type:complete len:577 (-) Transcript_16855:92-1822(-)